MNRHIITAVLIREEFGCAYRRGSYFYQSYTHSSNPL